ncbi:BlaI/MecI/CopY family transcriptional regulator [Gimesia algae]|uniref:Transcriptional repressor CopY n=1 Tax=Gimesia algae TaxID=2527971 RepID=A0A517VAB6_9PLAN|nr:BlaI/MecI/CopY family transcriptional regulator [Gimesia algae]QDT89936.1 Transcriptional repressor CopY [Gimesia algae]
MAKPVYLNLGARERQIMDAVHELGEASVAEVHEKLTDAPSYTTVRTMMRVLQEKGHLKFRREGVKYIYRPTEAPAKARKSAMQHLLKTFFSSSTGDAVAALLDMSGDKMSPEEYERLANLIEEARHNKKK